MTDLVSALSEEDKRAIEFHLGCVNPDDAKYWKDSKELSPYLSAEAEWRGFAFFQKVLLETRMEFGGAEQHHVDEVVSALDKISPSNMALLEDKLRHDQLAVIEEIGRFVSPETKALLHPGTTSYDIVDSTRSYLFRGAWKKVIRPKVVEVALKLCDLAQTPFDYVVDGAKVSGSFLDLLQAGRTHLQDTSPVSFGGMLASYARRVAERVLDCDSVFDGLKGKVSGIVGSGASVEVVIGKDEPDAGKRRALALDFERRALRKLDLMPDHTATQVVQKEYLIMVAASVVSLASVAANFAERVRILYSSAIGEVTSSDGKSRLAGSSADATKNNPIQYENIAGKLAVIQSGLSVVIAQCSSDLERDLRNSVQARYEPQLMLTRVFEMYSRLSKALDKLVVNPSVMADNLVSVREKPGDALTAITRAHGYVHPEFGVGHSAVAQFARVAQKSGLGLLDSALSDEHFASFFADLPEWQKDIALGKLEKYTGVAKDKALMNIEYVKSALDFRA